MAKRAATALFCAIGVAAPLSQAAAAEPFTLTSTMFRDGALMPRKVADNASAGANCVGENVSPPLSWTGVPAGTRSFALTVIDAEGRVGAGFVHWIAYGIPADMSGFAEGEASRPSEKYVAGKSDKGVPYFAGPCPPQGSAHHYVFELIATDLEPGALPPGLTPQELLVKLAGHKKGAAGVVGTFINPYPN